MNYRNRWILERYSEPSAGMPTCWTMKRLPCWLASASCFTGVYLGLRALGNGTENTSPNYEGFYYPIPKEMPYESTTTT